MTREEVYREIKEEFGLVPEFVQDLPDDTLEHDWKLLKTLEFKEGKIPMKYKHLMGLAVSGAIKCKYCTVFHTEAAKASGATDDEIHEALRYAMDTTGWSTFLNGLQIDFEKYSDEIRRIGEYLSRKSEKMEKVSV